MGTAPLSARVSDEATSAWWQRLSPRQVMAAGVTLALLIFGALVAFDQLSLHYHVLLVPMEMLDLIIAGFCGLLLMKLISDAQSRHRQMLQRLQIIAEMNHHIRNALEQIEMSAYASHDQQLIANLNAAAARIEWALREILPQNGKEDEDTAR